MRALSAVSICAALALGGCGGGGDESASTATTASSATTTPATTQDSASRPSQQSAGGQGKDKQAGGSTAKAEDKTASSSPSPPKAVKVPPISSAPVAGETAPAPGVKTVEGADDSVQTYGVESGASARTQAAIALAAYLDARRREDWGAACEALAQRPTEQLEKLAKSASAQGKEISGCAGAMAALGQAAPGSPQQFPGTTITEVLSLRGGGDVSSDPSYLIFTGPPADTLYSMPMYSEAGGWKVGLAVPAELPL